MLAARLFPGQNPIGRRVGGDTVVGIAENVKNGGLVGQDSPEIYFLRSNAERDWGRRRLVVIISSALTIKATSPWVRSQIAAIDPTVPMKIETLDHTVSTLANRPRFETSLLGFFAFSGLLMAVIGLYGVVSFVATQRTQEIGVRMALGATRTHILRLILGEGVRLIALGGVIGMGVALLASRLIASLLFGVSARDPWTYGAVALLLALAALAATLIPARAAMQVEPVVALRYE
jgi:putative ABC transport system permease protein